MNEDYARLPSNLKRPKDDGKCDRLLGGILPSITLSDVNDGQVDICKIDSKFVVLYFFPMMAVDGKNLPYNWDNIPGARGCTPQNLSIDKHMNDLHKHGAIPIGVTTQSIEELSKISKIRQLSQTLLSDPNLEFKEKLNLPTFEVEKKTFYMRTTLIIKESKIVKVFYPVFPPDRHVFEILEWLKSQSPKIS